MADIITLKDRQTNEPVYPRTHIDAVIDDTNTPLGTIMQIRNEKVDGKLTELATQVIYDVSANNGGATFSSLSALLSSENLSTLIPSTVRCGGMSIRFVQSSDNKYVQFRLMANAFSTTVSDWQGVDDELKIGSQNLSKSGVVNQAIFDSDFCSDGIKYKLYQGQTSNSGVITSAAGRVTTGVVPLPEKLPFILMIKGNYNVDLKYGTSKKSLTVITNVIAGSDVFGYYEVTSDAIGNATYIAVNIKRNDGVTPDDADIIGLRIVSKVSLREEVKERFAAIVAAMEAKASITQLNEEKERAQGVEATLSDKTQNLTSSSLIIPNALSQDDWEVGSINSSTGATTDVSTSVRTKNYLPAFKMTFVPQSGVVLRSIVYYYDANWNYLGYSNKMANTQIDNENASYPTAKWYKVRIYSNNDSTPITDLSDYFTNVISVTAYTYDYLQYKEIARNSANVLAGKKWVACGDSFTHGDFSGAAEDNYHISDGIYARKLKVYPYIIGNRNNMVIVNEALNGSHMGYVASRQNLSFSYQRYMNIPSDADYITLKFGINDDVNHQDIPIGTINDTTNTTFYGAWNVVMEYIIEHHPNAKIGIIVTNGSTIDIVEATIAIAHKYGISYLNEATGEQCSYIYRSNRTDVAQSIKDFRTSQWRVSAENGHPNAAAHEFESTVVENWLRSL